MSIQRPGRSEIRPIQAVMASPNKKGLAKARPSCFQHIFSKNLRKMYQISPAEKPSRFSGL